MQETGLPVLVLSDAGHRAGVFSDAEDSAGAIAAGWGWIGAEQPWQSQHQSGAQEAHHCMCNYGKLGDASTACDSAAARTFARPFSHRVQGVCVCLVALASVWVGSIPCACYVQLSAAARPLPPSLSFGPHAATYQACREAFPPVILPRLFPIQQWRSSKEQPTNSVTIVTQLSLER